MKSAKKIKKATPKDKTNLTTITTESISKEKSKNKKANPKDKTNLTTITTESISKEKKKNKKSKKINKTEKSEEPEIIEKPQKKEKYKSPIKTNRLTNTKITIDYIFRREPYKIKDQKKTLTFGEMKKIISNDLKINELDLQIIYLNNEIKNDKINIYDLIKDNKIKFFEVKKIMKPSEDIIDSYEYILTIQNISNGLDLNKQIDNFFQDLLIERKCICEPRSLSSYNISFPTNDLAFDFKRYLSILKKTNPLYSNIKVIINIPEKPKFDTIINSMNKDNNNLKTIKKSKNPTLDYYKKNLGNYITYSDIKKMERMDAKSKWLNQKGFIPSGSNINKK